MAWARSIFSILLVTLLAGSALAASPAERKAAQDFVETKRKQLTEAVKGSQSAQVEKLFDGMFDYNVLAKGSLEGHWEEFSKPQQDEFTELLKTLVRRAYRKNVDRTLDYNISYEGVEDSAGGVLVRTKAKSTKDVREEELEIAYVIAGAGANMRVHDVVTEGSSLVKSYQKNFSRVIRKNGIDGLLKKMREKVANEK